MKHLFETFMTDCTMIDKRSTPDGEGGFDYEWVDGASFRAAIVKDNSMTARVAEKQGVTEVYKITVPRSTPLAFHDVIRREKDGTIFRVTSNIIDSKTPDAASFQFGQVTAERWELV